jgi:phosphoribosyl 1,2-cyclic phosphodiesterase
MSHRQALNCRRLVLAHMSSNMLRHLAEIDVETAEDGKVIEL